MASDLAAGSPLANALQSLVQPKLAEFGWTTGGDDTTLFDYILLMLSNGKNEEQVATELSNDLLDETEGENTDTQRFSRWLFEQVDVLRGRPAGDDAAAAQDNLNHMEDAAHDVSVLAQDMEMEGVAEGADASTSTMYDPAFLSYSPTSAFLNGRRASACGLSIPTIESSWRKSSDIRQSSIQFQRQLLTPFRPTGPKAMRNGSGPKQARGGRMINQVNRQMNRNEDPLHRVRGSQGSGRINSHSREPPKGPRSQNIGRGLEAAANGRGAGNMTLGPSVNPMNGMGMGMPNMPMPNMGQNAMPGGGLNPQQQMALMSMYEQQAQMMQQIFSGQTPQPFVNPNFQKGHRKPFTPRGSAQGNKQNLPASSKFTKKEGEDENMTDSPATEGAEGMQVETSRADTSTTMCHFNQRCAKPDCAFVHSSPAAPKTVVVDMNETCSFGAACMNRKCVGKHPSPAQRQQYQAEQECIFYPNCRDPKNCPYKHPTAPPCRNGANCTTPGCTFWHSSTVCKFNPCTNPRCLHKHVEGQKQGNTFKGNVWVASKNGEEDKKEHVSERKFIDENQDEELILPGKVGEVAEAAL
ncbi:hypothetical protein N0V90_002223 [Kalmusia sp. IMI 367209]|nr:hypothetical protein N0V90_002223 [Kalmusia sp. IMI 367209]